MLSLLRLGPKAVGEEEEATRAHGTGYSKAIETVTFVFHDSIYTQLTNKARVSCYLLRRTAVITWRLKTDYDNFFYTYV